MMIVMGASLGGMRAIGAILGRLPGSFALPIAVVLHRQAETSDDLLLDLLQKTSALPVREVLDKEPILPGGVYLAPADYHLLVERTCFSLSVDERVQYARPSIDVLFESAADSFGAAVVGIVLTGANHDGAAGAARIVARGGRVLVQEPGTAENETMPRAALTAVPTARAAKLEEISQALLDLDAATLVPRS